MQPRLVLGSLALGSLLILGHVHGALPWDAAPPAAASTGVPDADVDLLTRMDAAYEHIAAAVRPAIVNIQTTQTVTQDQSPLFSDPVWREFFGRQFGNVPRSRREHALGSGVIVSPDGYIVTNNHVVAGATDVRVLLADNREFQARIVGTDPQSDIAVIKVDATHLPTATLGDSSTVRVGDMVMAFGNPFGLNFTITRGSISAVGRSGLNIEQYENFIQTDAAINPGNSGGALVNSRGQVIGLNTAILSNNSMGGQGGFEGIGFAIPSNSVRQVMDVSLVRTGHVSRGYLGVHLQALTPDLQAQFHAPDTSGALIADVAPETPVARAGLQAGDIVRTFNGQAVSNPSGLQFDVAGSAPWSNATLGVWRHDRETTVNVRLGELPRHVTQSNPSDIPPGNNNE